MIFPILKLEGSPEDSQDYVGNCFAKISTARQEIPLLKILVSLGRGPFNSFIRLLYGGA